jgi:hypothetical protein
VTFNGEGFFMLNGRKISVEYVLQEIRHAGQLPEFLGRFTTIKDAVSMRRLYSEAGTQMLTLTLIDGSTINFFFKDSNGGIQPSGGIHPPS